MGTIVLVFVAFSGIFIAFLFRRMPSTSSIDGADESGVDNTDDTPCDSEMDDDSYDPFEDPYGSPYYDDDDEWYDDELYDDDWRDIYYDGYKWRDCNTDEWIDTHDDEATFEPAKPGSALLIKKLPEDDPYEKYAYYEQEYGL